MMSFDALRKLTHEQREIAFDYLLSGMCADVIAQRMLEHRSDAQEVNPDTLVEEIRRLRMAIMNYDGFNSARGKPSSGGSQSSSLAHLEELAEIQQSHVRRLAKREQRQGKPVPELSKAVNVSVNLETAIQDMRFDLGLDEYKRVVPSPREREKATADAQQRREEEINKQIFEAVGVLDEIFIKRKITGRPIREPDSGNLQ